VGNSCNSKKLGKNFSIFSNFLENGVEFWRHKLKAKVEEVPDFDSVLLRHCVSRAAEN